METIQKKDRIFEVLNKIEEELQKNPQAIPDHVFQTLEAICSLVYAWRSSSKEEGWSKPLRYFSPDEKQILESRFHDFHQIGGGPKEDAEFEKEYSTFKRLVSGIYQQWNELTNALGIVAASQIRQLEPESTTPSSQDSPQEKKTLLETIRTEKSAEEFTSKAILSFFSVLVESLRIWVAYSSIDSSTYRVLLSFSQMILDTVRGNIRQALLSSLGLFGQGGYYISILSRLVLNLIATISPSLPMQLEFDIYKNLKTISSASLLWLFYTFAPQNLKYTVNLIFKEIQTIAKEDSISVSKLESQIRSMASEQQLYIPQIPLDNIPSYDDLMKLGELLRTPEIACLPAFQKLIAPLRSIFMLRLTLDLFNIPTGQIEFQELCARQRASTRKTKQQTGGRGKKTRRAEN